VNVNFYLQNAIYLTFYLQIKSNPLTLPAKFERVNIFPKKNRIQFFEISEREKGGEFVFSTHKSPVHAQKRPQRYLQLSATGYTWRK
jgi:hypothetical protein